MQNGVLALRRLLSFGVVFPAVLVMSVVACRAGSTGSAPSVTVGTTKSEVNLLIIAAQNQGYFADNGLDVVHKVYPSGVDAIGGLLGGELEFAAGSEFPFVGQVLSESDICTIAAVNRSSLEHLVARIDRGIRSIADLRGKTIGVPLGSRPEFALDRFLYFHGIDVSEVTLADVPVGESVEALVSGKVDAVAAWQPYTDEVVQQLGAQVVSWSVQENQPSYSLVMSRAGWTAENRDLVTRFLRSLVEAEEYVTRNPEAARALLHEEWNYDESYLSSIWPAHSFSVLLDQALVVAMEDQARWIMAHDPTGEQQMPDFLRYVCAEGLEAVKPEAVSLIR
jgi:NitT/TauT family transport system substrate-binding protein